MDIRPMNCHHSEGSEVMLSPKAALGAILAASILTLASTQSVAALDRVKVALVYFSPVFDTGWTFEHDKGRKKMEEILGDRVEAKIVENVAYGPDSLQVIRQLAADGNHLILTTSFGFMDQTLEAAELFPDVKFMHLDGYKSRENMATYSLRYYEPSYIAGIVAGAMSEGDTIGYVSSFPLPAVLRIINGFTLGAQSVKPGIKVRVIEVNSWFDPAREREAADALFAQGADVVAQVTDSSAPTLAAEKAGKLVVGFHSDRTSFGPASQLTAIIPIWGEFYAEMAQSVLDGTWTSQAHWRSMAQGTLGLAPLGEMVPQEVKTLVAERTAALVAGELHPFAGPIRDQSGTLRVAEGEVMPDDALYLMDWYVEGVEGKLPE